MRSLFTLASLALFAAPVVAQELKWANDYFYIDNQTEATKIAVAPDKRIAVAGEFSSHNYSRQGAFVCGLDHHGNVTWIDTVFQHSTHFPQAATGALMFNKSGHLYFAVNYQDSIKFKGNYYHGSGNCALLVKYDNAGTPLWIKNIPFARVNDVHCDKKNNTFVMLTMYHDLSAFGHTISVEGSSDVAIVKLSPADMVLDMWHVKGNNNGHSVKTTIDGDVLIFGSWADSLHYLGHHYDWSHKDGYDGYLLRTDSAGALLAFTPVFTSMFMQAVDMDVLENGNAMVCGYLSYKDGSWSYLETYDKSGSKVGEGQFSAFGYGAGNRIKDLATYKNNCWALHKIYHTVNYGLEFDDYHLFNLCKYNGGVTKLLGDTFNLPLQFNATGALCVDDDGDIYMASTLMINDTIQIGDRLLINNDEYDLHSTFFIAKFADRQNTLAIPETRGRITSALYPNPSNGVFFLKDNQEADVAVYNLLGAKVYSTSARGSVNLQHLEKGVYLAEVRTGQATGLQKIVLK